MEKNSLVEIRMFAPRENQHINRRLQPFLPNLLQRQKLPSTPRPRLRLLLRIRAKNHNVSPQAIGKLNRQVTQAADTDDADAETGLDDVDEGRIDGCAGALQGCGVRGRHVGGDLVQIGFLPDVVVCKGPGGEGGFAVDVAGVAEDFLARQAEFAFSAALGVFVSTSLGLLGLGRRVVGRERGERKGWEKGDGHVMCYV
jgi:hypothetical protein